MSLPTGGNIAKLFLSPVTTAGRGAGLNTHKPPHLSPGVSGTEWDNPHSPTTSLVHSHCHAATPTLHAPPNSHIAVYQ